MKAIGCNAPGPIDAPNALVDVELPTPQPDAHDLLVEVAAVSVNPVDTKVRSRFDPITGDEWAFLVTTLLVPCAQLAQQSPDSRSATASITLAH